MSGINPKGQMAVQPKTQCRYEATRKTNDFAFPHPIYARDWYLVHPFRTLYPQGTTPIYFGTAPCRLTRNNAVHARGMASGVAHMEHV